MEYDLLIFPLNLSSLCGFMLNAIYEEEVKKIEGENI